MTWPLSSLPLRGLRHTTGSVARLRPSLSFFQSSAKSITRRSFFSGKAERPLDTIQHSKLPSEDLIKVERATPDGDADSGVVIVRMRSNPVNSLTLELIEGLTKTIKTLEEQEVRGFVLASDCKAFSAGLDLKSIHGVSKSEFLKYWDAFEHLWSTLYLTRIATVAAIAKHAPGGGAILALSCDYRVFTEDNSYKMGLNEVKIGVAPPRWVQEIASSTVGERNAEFLLQTGLMCEPQEALLYGYVDELQPGGDVEQRALEVCSYLAEQPFMARGNTKYQMREHIKEKMANSGEYLWSSLERDECKKILDDTIASFKNKKK